MAAATGCSAQATVSTVEPPVGGSSGGQGGGRDGGSADGFVLVVPEVGPSLPPPDAETAGVPQDIATMRIDPADSVLAIECGQSKTVSFRAFATMQVGGGEVEITDRTVFYVPDNYLVGTFPLDGSSLFTTRMPTGSTDPPQRGGKVTIQAMAASNNIPITTVTTSLTVKVVCTGGAAAGSPGATPAIPANPESKFTGSTSTTLAPTLVYPNDGVMLPPNMRQLEVHFMPGTKTGELYEISMLSDFSEYRAYTRCYAEPKKFLAATCVFDIDPDTLDVIAESNGGTGPVTLAVRGTDETSVGSSASFKVEFAADRVDGAIYYWTTSDPAPRIMRFDFASQSALAAVIQPSDLPGDSGTPNANTRCVGCHALSRDGKRMVASTGASWDGYLVYINDLSLPKTAANWLTVDGRNNGVAGQNRVMTASFNPDGTQFVADAPVSDSTLGSTKLAFHDGVTGVRQSSLDVGFAVSFPDWSPDGQSIAVTHIYGQNSSTIEFQEGGISVIRRSAAGWAPATEVVVVPRTTGKSRYTPTFVPDSSFLLYSEATRQTGDSDGLVNAYSDPSAAVWAVKPEAGATPVLLARANATGVADKLILADGRSSLLVQRISSGLLMNTYPRAAPFEGKQDGHKLYWFTVASQRRPGVRAYTAKTSVVGDEPTQVLLWMFALDADQVLAGKDGSYPGFFLPFQDLTTSNHMAAWTQKYVSDNPPPPPPSPPPLPPLTVLPPIPIYIP
ncbi:MAG TPA: hypothetical protein VJ801_12620 [Polyangia bacterium]|nr:hypothetical protein [Polyangia bacterium]